MNAFTCILAIAIALAFPFSVSAQQVSSGANTGNTGNNGVQFEIGLGKGAQIGPQPASLPLAYKEISGVWMNPAKGLSQDFELKNVQISGESFTADFFLRAVGSYECSVVQKRMIGTYSEGVFSFRTQASGCDPSHYHNGTFNIHTMKGEYVAGRLPSGKNPGYYTITKIIPN